MVFPHHGAVRSVFPGAQIISLHIKQIKTPQTFTTFLLFNGQTRSLTITRPPAASSHKPMSKGTPRFASCSDRSKPGSHGALWLAQSEPGAGLRHQPFTIGGLLGFYDAFSSLEVLKTHLRTCPYILPARFWKTEENLTGKTHREDKIAT